LKFIFTFSDKKVSFSDRKNYLGRKLNIPPPPVSPTSFRQRIPLRRQRRETGQQETVFQQELLFDPFNSVNTSARDILRAHIQESNARYLTQRKNAFVFPHPPLPPRSHTPPPIYPTPPPISNTISEVIV
jgi:hypothetical protein